MKTVSVIASFIVTIALVFYATGFTRLNRKKLISSNVLLFYTIGVCLDITSTILMIIGSSKGMMTLHGMIGYSSLLGMLTDTILLWRYNRIQEPGSEVNRSLHIYSTIAFTWWVIAYITGGLLVAVSKMKG